MVRPVEQEGTAAAHHPEYARSAHVDVKGLRSDSEYYYRFRVGAWISSVGRTRTAPAPGSEADSPRLAAVADQAYQDGYYPAYRHLAQEDVDVVFFLGDHLYEYAVDSAGGARRYTDRKLPDVFNREATTLADYRMRYSLYKSDADLQAAHAPHPSVVTWDDHGTENNYAGAYDEKGSAPEDFLVRRAAACRAYGENQPLRAEQLPNGPDARPYRRLTWGSLAQFAILDTRQYRSDQDCNDRPHAPGPESDDPARTLTGADQERWPLDGWQKSTALWHVLPQQVCFFPAQVRPDRTGPGLHGRLGRLPGLPRPRHGGREGRGHLQPHGPHRRRPHRIRLRHQGEPRRPGLQDGQHGLHLHLRRQWRQRHSEPAEWDTYMKANPHIKQFDGRRG